MFTIERGGNIIELEILEKESDYSVNINVKMNGEVIAKKLRRIFPVLYPNKINCIWSLYL